VDGLVNPLGMEHQADGQQDKHLISLLVDLIILIGLGLKMDIIDPSDRTWSKNRHYLSF
jgi:hypothetical protein